MENQLEKIMKNLEKLLNRDFGFITVGRILAVADNKNITEDIVNSICNRLNIQTNHITKDQLKKIIEELEIKLDYLEPEIPKVKRIID